MSEIISKLQQDHRQLVDIFDLLENELYAIENGSVPNLVLLSHILEYIKYYPDMFHHPLEDIVFDCLLWRDGTQQLVKNLQNEHLELVRMTNEFQEEVTRLAGDDKDLARHQVGALGREYLNAQRKHMETEDTIAFPQAIRLLNKDDWKQIHEYAAAISPEADPIFGSSVQTRFRELRESINNHKRTA